jgi:predicted transcriptional regulator
MDIRLTAEQAVQLSRLAALAGKSSDELAREVFSRGLADEARFLSAVQIGREQAARGEFVEAMDVWASVEAALRS